MTKLTELDGVFVGQYNEADKNFVELPNMDGAQGVLFDCPLCRGHSILAWFRNPKGAKKVPDDIEPGPGRWSIMGDSLENLTLTPSINLDRPAEVKCCRWHGFVTNGDAA